MSDPNSRHAEISHWLAEYQVKISEWQYETANQVAAVKPARSPPPIVRAKRKSRIVVSRNIAAENTSNARSGGSPPIWTRSQVTNRVVVARCSLNGTKTF